MTCPRCDGGVLDERERDGLLVDVCVSCRGIWLDRGELEKLIARATRELEDGELRRSGSTGGGGRDDDEVDDDDDRGRHPRRPRRWIDSLGDIFS